MLILIIYVFIEEIKIHTIKLLKLTDDTFKGTEHEKIRHDEMRNNSLEIGYY